MILIDYDERIVDDYLTIEQSNAIMDWATKMRESIIYKYKPILST